MIMTIMMFLLSLFTTVVNCGDPGILINGQRTFFGTTYRLVVTFECNDGFTMVGDGFRRCEANGEWTGEIPECIGEFLFGACY